MIRIQPTSTILVCGALVALTTPSYAGAHALGCGHMTSPRPMMPPPAAHMSMHHMPMMHGTGCCGGGGHMAYGGKPSLGMHWKGMHFYGMGGGHMAESHAMGGHSYPSGSYGAGGIRPTLGTHMLGSHYYGMASGSLAQKYGQLEYHVSPVMPPKHWGTMYGSGYGSMSMPKVWAATSYRDRYSAHYAYRFRYGYHVPSLGHYGTHHTKKPWAGASEQWGYNGAPAGQWAYAQ